MSERPLGEVVAALGASEPMPAAGSALAVTVAVAAGLLAKCARKAQGRAEGADEIFTRAQQWQERALQLADEDVAAYEAVLDARASSAAATLADAAEPPLAIAELAAEVAASAAALAGRGKPWLRGDALAVALLAESAARAAATLVRHDLAEAGADDHREQRVRALVAAAGESRTEAEAAVTRSEG